MGTLPDIANRDKDNDGNDDNDNNNHIKNDEDGESCGIDNDNKVMLSPSSLNNELLMLMYLNDNKCEVFDVDDTLVKSMASMLAVNNADKGGKDKKDIGQIQQEEP